MNNVAAIDKPSDVVALGSDRDSSDEPVRLDELGIVAGQLTVISSPDQDGYALACVGGTRVEVPASFAQELEERELVGQRIWLALIKGKLRAGVMSL